MVLFFRLTITLTGHPFCRRGRHRVSPSCPGKVAAGPARSYDTSRGIGALPVWADTRGQARGGRRSVTSGKSSFPDIRNHFVSMTCEAERSSGDDPEKVSGRGSSPPAVPAGGEFGERQQGLADGVHGLRESGGVSERAQRRRTMRRWNGRSGADWGRTSHWFRLSARGRRRSIGLP